MADPQQLCVPSSADVPATARPFNAHTTASWSILCQPRDSDRNLAERPKTSNVASEAFSMPAPGFRFSETGAGRVSVFGFDQETRATPINELDLHGLGFLRRARCRGITRMATGQQLTVVRGTLSPKVGHFLGFEWFGSRAPRFVNTSDWTGGRHLIGVFCPELIPLDHSRAPRAGFETERGRIATGRSTFRTA